MLYIHHTFCISPQQTGQNIDMNALHFPVENKLHAIEPAYENIPPALLRRMGTAIRMGTGAALPLIKNVKPVDGIIIGTAKGGMEDCIKFLNEIVQYEEGILAPGSFVQSTTNAIAGQLGLMSNNKGYNITHVHRGLAFENAVIDSAMKLKEYPSHCYLMGGVDEISSFNYNLERLAGSYKKETVGGENFYNTDSPGSVAGESAAMFIANNQKEGCIAKLEAIGIFHTQDEYVVKQQLRHFLDNHITANKKIDVLLSGENGDNRLLKYYHACENEIDKHVAVARFKHMCGEHPTASAFALWIVCQLLQQQFIPRHMIKKYSSENKYGRVLIYNNYKGYQHSFMLVSTSP